MSTFICEYCNKSFISIYTLNNHKKTAKFCIELQKKNSEKIEIEIETFSCEHCDKEFTTKTNLRTHVNTCKNKINNDKNRLIFDFEKLKKEHEKVLI